MSAGTEVACHRCGFLYWVVGLIRLPFFCPRCSGHIKEQNR